jgi:hypothetical protein
MGHLYNVALPLGAGVMMWLLETITYEQFAHVEWRRAMLTSLVANFAGTVFVPTVARLAYVPLSRIGMGAGGLGELATVFLVLVLAAKFSAVWGMNRWHPDYWRLFGTTTVVSLVTSPLAAIVMAAIFFVGFPNK